MRAKTQSRHRFTLILSDAMRKALQDVAREENTSVAKIIRRAIATEMLVGEPLRDPKAKLVIENAGTRTVIVRTPEV